MQTITDSVLGETALVPGGRFPDDLDTTSLALQVLQPSTNKVLVLLDEMAKYVNDDGNFQVRSKVIAVKPD